MGNSILQQKSEERKRKALALGFGDGLPSSLFSLDSHYRYKRSVFSLSSAFLETLSQFLV